MSITFRTKTIAIIDRDALERRFEPPGKKSPSDGSDGYFASPDPETEPDTLELKVSEVVGPSKCHLLEAESEKSTSEPSAKQIEPVPTDGWSCAPMRVVHSDSFAGIAEELAVGDGAIAILLSDDLHEVLGDSEGNCSDGTDNNFLLIAAWGRGVWIIDFRATGFDLAELGPVIESGEVIAFDAKDVLQLLREKCGIQPRTVFCAKTAGFLIAGIEWSQFDALRAACNEKDGNQVRQLFELRCKLEPTMAADNLARVFRIEMSLLPVVVAMQAAGFPVNRAKLNAIKTTAARSMVESIDMARRLLDAPALMLSSPEQIKSALLKAGMDVEDTSAETLASIDHDGVRAILAFRMHQKTCEQAAKYIRELCEDGRIHSQFNPLGTVTGRFSSENPTLHNVKRGVIRTAFEAGEGMALVVSDYSQIELRAAAAISGDKAMLEAFERREDLHIKTASMILRKAETDITAEERQTAKAANFGLIFGLGAKGLVRDARNKFGVSLTIEQAADIRKSFFAAYPGIASWHKTAWREAAAMNGLAGRFACTITGRRRLIKQDCDEWTRFTTLVNTPVQGACGDGIKIAMIRIAALLPRTAQMVATIHDELVFVCPSDEADSLREMVAAEMKAAMSELFPQLAIEVEAKVCNNWGEK